MQLSLLTTFPEELRSEWDALLESSAVNVPFLRFDYQYIWWQARGGGEWPDAQLALITARQDGKLVAVAPLFYTPNHQGQARLMLVGSVEVSDYLDFIAAPGMLAPFIDELLPFLRQADLPAWHSLDLYNLFDDSSSLPILSAAANKMGLGCQVEQVYHCPYIPLPGDWEVYLAGIDKKQRHEIRRKMRRLESSELSNRWYHVTDPAQLESEIDAFFALMHEDQEKTNFLTPQMSIFMRQVFQWAFSQGWLMMAFLEIDGKKAGGYVSLDYLNRLWVYNSGFSREHWEYSPGWVLLGYLLQWANETHHSEFDFMRGDEEYKYRFGGIDRHLVRATLSLP